MSSFSDLMGRESAFSSGDSGSQGYDSGGMVSSGGTDMGISAGVGGLITRVHGRKNRLWQQYMQERNWEREDSFLQRRVRDAQAAGIHPLFALGGGNANTYSAPNPINVGEFASNMSQAVARTLANNSAYEKRRQALELEAVSASASKDAAIAGYYNSEAARLRQSSGTQGSSRGVPLTGVSNENVDSLGFNTGNVQVVPNEVKSAMTDDSGTAAGKAPLGQWYSVGNSKLWLPAANDSGEAIESLGEAPLSVQYGFMKQNYNRLGYKEFRRAMYDFGGTPLGVIGEAFLLVENPGDWARGARDDVSELARRFASMLSGGRY